MIESILDNDLYKFTMQQAVHALYPRAEAQYAFINRGKTGFPANFQGELQKRIDAMAELRITQDELDYLSETCYFLTPVYLDFLKHFRFTPDSVKVNQSGGKLSLTLGGPWYRIILWEVPLLAMVSELYYSLMKLPTITRTEAKKHNQEKGKYLRDGGVDFAEFGTRRRFSFANQKNVISDILAVQDNTMIGTSNVHLARESDIKPIGTHAHEWFMFHAAEHGYIQANMAAIKAWSTVFQGHLGIALTDTYTTDLFLHSFDAVMARLFDGVRQDSGDPFLFIDKLVSHYQKLKINPLTKTIVFSDGLDCHRALKIKEYCRNRINASFGIGTHLSNDLGPESLNIVIKLSHCRGHSKTPWMPMVKLSDNPKKHTGQADEIELCLRTIKRSSL